MKKKNAVDLISIHMMDSDYKDDQILKEIMDAGNLLETGRDGRTYLIHAALYKRVTVAKKLLKCCPELINIPDSDLGYTPLHAAVTARDEEMIKLLLKHKANVNARDAYGNTPLFRASHLDQGNIKLLIAAGADPHIKNRSGISPYEAFAAYPEIVKMMDKAK